MNEGQQALFERWWASYPRKQSKGAAEKSWERLGPDEAFTTKMVLAVEAQQRYRKWAIKQNKFVADNKLPATWLNQKCWEDQIPSMHESEGLVAKCPGKPCSVKGCVCDTVGPAFDLCQEHLTFSLPAWKSDSERLRSQLTKVDKQVGESWQEACQRWWKEEGKEALKRKLIGKRTPGLPRS